MEEFRSWLSSTLQNDLNTDAEVYTGYVEGVMQDDSEDLDDRCETVMGMISAAAEDVGEDKLIQFREQLVTNWNAMLQAEAAAESALELQREEEERAKLEKLKAEHDAAEAAKAANNPKKELTEEEKLARKALLEQYDYTVSEVAVNAEGQVVEAPLSVNPNREAVKDYHAHVKQVNKKAHQDNLRDIKKQQQAQKAKKEQDKARRQGPAGKKERRRG